MAERVVAFGPGRVNLIGEHTDYNDGFVLPFAIEARTYVAARVREDGVLRMRSVQQHTGDVSIDLVDRGRLTVKGASGDVRIGVKAGVPVWTDITTVSGTIRSELQGAGQPQEGEDHIEVRAKTVSGDIALSEV